MSQYDQSEAEILINEEDYADFSFDDLNNALLEEVASSVSVGTVDASGNYLPLYDVSNEDDTLNITPTAAGASLLKGAFGEQLKADKALEINEFDGGYEPWQIAWMLGLPAGDDPLYHEHVGRALSHCSANDIFHVALGVELGQGRFVIGSSHEKNRVRLGESCLLDMSKILNPKSASDVSDKIRSIRNDATSLDDQAVRVIAEAHIEKNNTLTPVLIKTVSDSVSPALKREEEFQLVLEFAALKALKSAGIKASSASLVRDRNGGISFLSARFDRATLKSDGSAVMSHSIAGKEMLDLNDIAIMKGEHAGIEPSDVLSKVADVYREEGLDIQPLLTLAIFNKLIGNEDLHAENWAFLSSVNSQGKVTIEPSPAFDVTPYMMFNGNPDVYRSSGIQGKALANLKPVDVATTDKFFSKIYASDATLFERSFEAASSIRDDMKKLIETDLLQKRYVTKEEVGDFDRYLSTPVMGSKSLDLLAEMDGMEVEEVSYGDLPGGDALFGSQPRAVDLSEFRNSDRVPAKAAPSEGRTAHP